MASNRYYAKRIGQSFVTVYAVVTLSFVLIRLMPGGPIDYLRAQYMRQNLNQEEIQQKIALYTNIETDAPMWEQYVEYMAALAQFDFGRSIFYAEPVAGLLGSAVPWTVLYMSISLCLMFAIGVSMGAFMAYREGSRFDTASTLLSIVANSVPYYIAAILLLYLLGFEWSVFPTAGRMNPQTSVGLNLPFVVGVLTHAALPVLSLVVTGFGGKAITMRGNAISELGEDYLRVARLRGLPERRIALRYVARNAILPMYTGIMISIGTMFGGSVILEKIFAYQGVGYYVFKSISSRDYPLMMGGFILITVAVVIGVLIADLTYGKLDPRAGGESDEAY
ncbi:ABC transporter permease [Halosimplex halophilum]|uniref:ABC transporter permease n=1 Tax=Halosimplex halophilum TaxID=2559572 RepID=UPI00107FC038|nr:ABC transporter permease [Halosimplex halophilum]